MCLCLKYLVCRSKRRVELGVWEVVFFSVLEEIVYILSINSTYVSQLRKGFGLLLSFYLWKRVSLCFRYAFFCVSSLILSHLELLRIELLKLTSSILMEIVTIPVVLFDQLYFYMHQPIKDWLLENYPWARLSLN